jgi:hypothetical protein
MKRMSGWERPTFPKYPLLYEEQTIDLNRTDDLFLSRRTAVRRSTLNTGTGLPRALHSGSSVTRASSASRTLRQTENLKHSRFGIFQFHFASTQIEIKGKLARD